MINFTTSTDLVPYQVAHDTMLTHVDNIIAQKIPEQIWFLEHPPTYTAGTSANSEDLINDNGFEVHKTGRGGQYTYHGPGVNIAYVMLDLNMRNKKDVRWFVYSLEQWIINTLAAFDIEGFRRQGRVGIWTITPEGKECKIAAIGVRLKKWVTYHGIAINVNPDLHHFEGIVPCGIKEYGVTSMQALGKETTFSEVNHVLKESICF